MSLQITACISCGRYGPSHFCSQRCQEWFDAGNPPYSKPDLSTWYRTRDGKILPLGQTGFLIACAHCAKSFDSKGLRCCSPECERHYRDREDSRAALATVGDEPI